LFILLAPMLNCTWVWNHSPVYHHAHGDLIFSCLDRQRYP
jgi:hypothetical protein